MPHGERRIVPTARYAAIAEVLAHVHQFRGKEIPALEVEAACD